MIMQNSDGRKLDDSFNYKKSKIKHILPTLEDDNGFVRIDPRFCAGA